MTPNKHYINICCGPGGGSGERDVCPVSGAGAPSHDPRQCPPDLGGPAPAAGPAAVGGETRRSPGAQVPPGGQTGQSGGGQHTLLAFILGRYQILAPVCLKCYCTSNMIFILVTKFYYL